MHIFPFAENGSIVSYQYTKGFLELSFDKVLGERLMSAGRGLWVGVPRMTSSPNPARAPSSKPVIPAQAVSVLGIS